MNESVRFAAAFGDQLREWRQHRRLSQLALSLEAGISARHLSFVETGRSQPSRELVLRLASPIGELALISTTTIFGGPVDVTLSELAIESFFPADAITALRAAPPRARCSPAPPLPRRTPRRPRRAAS